ncbi:MAG: glycoside hydrolase family 88 protein [Akkermansiaceae bacterium]|nr:glycoside hydrolase family 88 protein [Akkermansiaceae bacterium]
MKIPHLIPSMRAALLSIVSLLLFMPAHAAQPGEDFASFTDDGGWCWFADPRAVTRDGKTFTGWVTENGSVVAACLDHSTREVTHHTLHRNYERDDHDNPSFLFLPDGRLQAFYTKHNRAEEINTRTTKLPGDISAWGPEWKIKPKDASKKNSNITYSNPFMLSEENNAIHLFWRGRSFKPTTAKSLDGGKTWSEASPVFSMPGLPNGNRPYAKYASNGKDRIHMLFTDGHPRNEPTNSVYYVCYREGAYYKADGTRICGADELPISPDQADKIYDATESGIRAWIWEVAFDEKDQPVVVYTRHPSEKDHRYHYARWIGEEWQDTELCEAGKWFPQTPAGKTEPEPHYSSGLALDHKNPSIVYLTRPVEGVSELEKWTTADSGKSWNSEAITANSKHDNIRPFVLRDPTPDGPTVLWQTISGHYVHYTNYRCSIKMDHPETVIHPKVIEYPPLSDAIEPKAVLATMERVGDWQIDNPSHHRPTDWTQGAGYTGIMALAGISNDPKYRDAMLKMGEENGWKLGPREYHADDHAVGQTYAELYFQLREPKMIAPMRELFDKILANPREGTLEFKTPGNQDRWSWCDSLFMAPPAFLRLYVATGDERYMKLAVDHWWRTSDYLYDEDEHVYYRDSTYFEKRESNGAKVFWGRGNGWVIGGLVRMLQYLPSDHPSRPRFEKQFKDMCAKLLTCQQPDGLWRASLLDPTGYPLKETSSSAFNTYAFAWGVNQGLLERESYEPAVRKAWTALVSCVQNDGKLTHVQPIGADPQKFPDDATEVYGVGAFLLAGSEVYRMGGLEDK